MATKAAITWEEFLAAGKEGQRWEYVDGKVVFITPVFRPHGRVNMGLDYELEAYTRRHPEWVGYGTDTAFTMASGNWRCPDAALVRKERDVATDPKGPTPFPPDIAFEILSPSDTGSEMQSKRQDYYESKVIQVWLDPQRKTAEVISLDRPAQHFRAPQVVTLPELPDFQLDLNALFA
jgi:Uma2 family endonuclease